MERGMEVEDGVVTTPATAIADVGEADAEAIAIGAEEA